MNPLQSNAIEDKEKKLVEQRESLLAQDPRAKLPLLCRIYRDPENKPLKIPLTNRFPLLSRRQRRELMRCAVKAQKKAAKAEASA